MSRFQGLVKVAYTDPSAAQKPWFGRMLDHRDAFTRDHPNIAATVNTLVPGQAMYSNKALDWWERQQQNHPLATELAHWVPVAGAVPLFADAASDARRGGYGSALANAGFGVLSLYGGGAIAIAKGLGLAGRAAKLGRGTAAATKLMQARTPRWVRRVGAEFGARVPGTYTRPFVNAATRLPGVRNMTPATATALENAGNAMSTSWPARHGRGIIGAGMAGMAYDAARGTGSQYQQQPQYQSPGQGRGAGGVNIPAAAAQSAYSQLGKTWHPYQARR